MARIEAREIIAHGLMCDNCGGLTPVRNATSKSPGYYIDAERVTENNVHRVNPEQLFFCSKECMLNALEWKFSHMVDTRVGPMPRSDPGQQYELIPREIQPVERKY